MADDEAPRGVPRARGRFDNRRGRTLESIARVGFARQHSSLAPLTLRTRIDPGQGIAPVKAMEVILEAKGNSITSRLAKLNGNSGLLSSRIRAITEKVSPPTPAASRDTWRGVSAK